MRSDRARKSRIRSTDVRFIENENAIQTDNRDVSPSPNLLMYLKPLNSLPKPDLIPHLLKNYLPNGVRLLKFKNLLKNYLPDDSDEWQLGAKLL